MADLNYLLFALSDLDLQDEMVAQINETGFRAEINRDGSIPKITTNASFEYMVTIEQIYSLREQMRLLGTSLRKYIRAELGEGEDNAQ